MVKIEHATFQMEYKDRIKALQRASLYNPEMTDRELSILIDAEFGKDDEEKEESK